MAEHRIPDGWRALAGDRWVRAMGSILLLLLAAYAIPWNGSPGWTRFAEEFADQLLLLPVVAAALVAFACSRRREDRRFWGRLALGLGVWWGIRIFYLALPDWIGTPRGDLVGDLLYAVFYLALILAAHVRPHRPEEPNRWMRWVDTWATVGFVGVLVTYFVLVPLRLNYAQYETWLPSLYMYVALDLFLLYRFAHLTFGATAGRYRAIYGLLAATMLSFAVTDSLECASYAGALTLETAGWHDLLWWPPFPLLLLAARLGARHAACPLPVERSGPLARAPFRMVAPLVAQAFLLPIAHTALYGAGVLDPLTREARDQVVFVSLVLLGGFVMTQQYLLARANRRLQRDLAGTHEQLNHATKMEAIGRLAGGVAHDFNNLLTAVTCHTEMLLARLAGHDPLRREIGEIGRAADRATGLTRQLLAFSRRQVLDLRVIDLNAVVDDMDMMLRRLIGDSVRLVTVFGGDIGAVRADPGQIEQVIMNLAVNARDAMPDGGTLTIRTDGVYLEEDEGDLEAGPYVALIVRDTGTGMDGETRSRIFEPFFTTKGLAKGTGLGLSTVFGIVRQSGGDLRVDSRPGEGAEFVIRLPRVNELPEARSESRTPRADAASGATVLVVEDEPAVRELVRDILELSGYRVIEAADGEEALAVARRHGDSIDLLLTDVVMPRMNGPELVRRLLGEHGETRVLYMSGYNEERLFDDEAVAGLAYLQKPFTPDDLSNRVRDVLSREGR